MIGARGYFDCPKGLAGETTHPTDDIMLLFFHFRLDLTGRFFDSRQQLKIYIAYVGKQLRTSLTHFCKEPRRKRR
jgi:hypothetical protein